MTEPISYVKVERLEACGRASAPFLTCLPVCAVSSDEQLTVQLKIRDRKHLHIIMNFLFIVLAVLDPSLSHLTFSTD